MRSPEIGGSALNARLTITTAFFDPETMENTPAVIRIDAASLDGSWSGEADVRLDQVSVSTLRKAFPLLRIVGQRKSDIVADLFEQLYRGLTNGSIRAGYIFREMGMVTLPDGKTVAIRGGEVIGDVGKPYIIANEIRRYRLFGNGTAFSALLPLLLTVQLPTLMVLAFTLLASIRSILVDGGIALQAVLLLEGQQGLGKTTVATRVGAVYENAETKRTAGVMQLGSTFASVRDTLLTFRDAAIVIDDLCLSASAATQRSSLDTAAKIVRMATGTIPLTKKRGDETEESYSQAMAIITAEYTFPNMSDLTRCIVVPVRKQLRLPDILTPDMAGDAVRHFSTWVIEHREEVIERIKAAARGDLVHSSFDQRIRTNYGILTAVWNEFLLSLQVDDAVRQRLQERFMKAVGNSLLEHAELIEKLRADVKRGNIAYIVLGALETKALKPGKREIKDNDGRMARYGARLPLAQRT